MHKQAVEELLAETFRLSNPENVLREALETPSSLRLQINELKKANTYLLRDINARQLQFDHYIENYLIETTILRAGVVPSRLCEIHDRTYPPPAWFQPLQVGLVRDQ